MRTVENMENSLTNRPQPFKQNQHIIIAVVKQLLKLKQATIKKYFSSNIRRHGSRVLTHKIRFMEEGKASFEVHS
jgi:hypothetical protein